MDQLFMTNYQMSFFGPSKVTASVLRNIKTNNKTAPLLEKQPKQQQLSHVTVTVTHVGLAANDSFKENRQTGHSTSGSSRVAKKQRQHNEPQNQQRHEQRHQSEQRHGDYSSACSCHKMESPGSAFLVEDVPPAYVFLPSELAEDLVTRTETRFASNVAKSAFLAGQPVHLCDRVPTFSLNDNLIRGGLIASGGFASVFEAEVKETGDSRYVVKHIAPKLVNTAAVKQAQNTASTSPTAPTRWYNTNRKLYLALKDLVMEAHLLASLDHPNILPLCGISAGGVSSFANIKRSDAFFLVLPRLACTLEDKIDAWRHEHLEFQSANVDTVKHLSSLIPFPPIHKRQQQEHKADTNQRRQQQQNILRERLEIIIDVLKALEYLHERRIMHRDIKPANIGFDEDGCVKVFDFGLAKELPAEQANYRESCPTHKHSAASVFRLPGNTGTCRYMAPEIISRLPYNCKVDVYSTTITLWQCLALRKPYGLDASGQFIKECVAIYGDRPVIPRKWPRRIRKALNLGWTRDVASRPSSSEMRSILESLLRSSC